MQRVMNLLGFLSKMDFGNMSHSSMIVNYLVIVEGVKNAKHIFGPDFTLLKRNW